MLTLRGRWGIEEGSAGPGRRVRAAAASLVIHALVVLGMWQVLQFPRAVRTYLDARRNDGRAQQLRYVEIAPSAAARPTAGAPPNSARTGVQAAIAPPITPPGPATGPLASGRGEVKGVQPGFTEPRVWIQGEVVVAPALTGDAKLDSAVAARVYAYRDSVSANTYQPNKFERGDWTHTTKDGKKYGVDQQFIRLGKVSIPTALLGLLPLNQLQGNPIAYERERRLAAMRADILEHAQMAMNEEEFRQAVKQIRERKERERKEAEKKKAAAPKVISER
jgi:hypothetical protein